MLNRALVVTFARAQRQRLGTNIVVGVSIDKALRAVLPYMAHPLCSAKSGSDWGASDLAAYNIEVQFQDAATFFGVYPLPEPIVADEVLTRTHADDMESDLNYKLIRYMDLAMDPVPTEASAVDDFAVQLLTVLGYLPRTRMARTRVDLPFQICGEHRYAKTDVCIVDAEDVLLLLQEDKRHKEQKDSEAQLIAEAIAAFQANNSRRTRVRHFRARTGCRTW